MNEAVKYPGERVSLGGTEYVIPSLGVKQARTLWPKVRLLNEGVTIDNLPEKMGIACEIVHAALSRNYPELTVEQVEEFVDMSNFKKLMSIVTATSGVKPAPGEEPAAPQAAA